MIQRQISVDPRVKGTITVYSEQPLSVREAYLTYQSALRGLGFAVVESGGLLKVVPEADAKLQAGTVAVGAVPLRGDQVITQIFTLRHENPNNLVTVLRPLISANNTINASPGSNSLVITDYADNLQRIALMIAALDQPSQTDFEVVPLKHALASDLAPVLQRMADTGVGAATPPGMPGGGSSSASVAAHPPSNSLFIRAPNAARHAALKAAIEKLDRPQAGGRPAGNLWVVYLKNADATRLATVLRAAFPATGGGGSGGGRPGAGGHACAGRPARRHRSSLGRRPRAPITAAGGALHGRLRAGRPGDQLLIITAAEPLYRQVRALIDQLDTRRAQVYIESMIVEVVGRQRGRLRLPVAGHHRQAAATPTCWPRAPTSALRGVQHHQPARPAPPSAPSSAGPGPEHRPDPQLRGHLRAGGRSRARCRAKLPPTSCPPRTCITLDNEEAKIVVGSNVPFITGQYTGGRHGRAPRTSTPSRPSSARTWA
jgi:general secretion pathway protein D